VVLVAILKKMMFTTKDVYIYAYDDDIDNLRLALDYGNNSIDWYMTQRGSTALHAAASEGHTACIGLLLDRGADIESKNIDGWTALHVAINQDHIDCINVLLNRGADIECVTNEGFTTLHLALVSRNIDCICLLLERGAIAHESDIEEIDDEECKQIIINKILHR